MQLQDCVLGARLQLQHCFWRCAQCSHLSALVRPAPPARPFWPAIARGCVLLHVNILPVLPCPGGRVLIQLDPQKAALTFLAMHLLHIPKLDLL